MNLFPNENESEFHGRQTIKNAQSVSRANFNSEAVIIAREMAGLSQTEVAERCRFSQAKISRFEDGIAQPSHEDSEILASALRVPVRFFYRSDVRRSVFNSFYRKRKTIPQRTVMKFNAEVCLRQIQIDRLVSKVEMDSQPIPRFDPDDFGGELAPIAQSLRQFLRLPPGPVKRLVRPLEDAGVVIVLDNFEVPKLDGVSTITNGGTPVIFLNRSKPASRRRFTLAHEFAHTALHEWARPDVDEEADSLASEFLMPKADVTPDLSHEPLTLRRLADLKLKWKVSMAALLFRAKTLGVIAPRRYSYLQMQLSQAGYRVSEPYEEYMEDDEPSLESEILSAHKNDLGYSDEEIAISLDMDIAEYQARSSGVKLRLY